MLNAMKVPARITSAEYGGYTVVTIDGPLTASGGDMLLRTEVGSALEGGASRLVIDFSDLGSLDSSGLGELLRAVGLVRERSGLMAWVGCPRNMLDILEICNVSLDDVLMCAALEDAVSALGTAD